jgi:predicted CXXCH cytochrome family protein
MSLAGEREARPRDPGAWGEDHVDKPLPRFEDGNSCLFCHRTTIGPSWQTNRHATTVRPVEDDEAAREALSRSNKLTAQDVEFVLGRSRALRFLRSAGGYGKLAIANEERDADGQETGRAEWDSETFGAKCAGCHTSAVETSSRTFQTISLDCHTCHGVAEIDHTKDAALMLLSASSRTAPEVEISICGQCHLRGGISKSTGLPYPNQFVPGDNLFRDFEVDLSDKALATAGALERHILENTRDVVVRGLRDMTCTSCHAIHGQSSARHRQLVERPLCFVCHLESRPLSEVRAMDAHNEICRY